MLDGRDANKRVTRQRGRRGILANVSEAYQDEEDMEELSEIDDLYVNQSRMELQSLRLPKSIYHDLSNVEKRE